MRLTSLHVYPVKGCHRVDVDAAEVQPWGLVGDRRWFPVDEAGVMVSQREVPSLTQVQPTLVGDGVRLAAPGLPDLTVPALAGDYLEVTVWRSQFKASPAGPAADAWLSEAAGRPLRLVWMDDPTRRPVNPDYAKPGDVVSAADGYPLLLTNAASLAVLNDWIAEGGSGEGPLPMTRFRPNVVVDGAPAWAEDGWLGRRIRIGEVVFRMPEAVRPLRDDHERPGDRREGPGAAAHARARPPELRQELLFGIN